MEQGPFGPQRYHRCRSWVSVSQYNSQCARNGDVVSVLLFLVGIIGIVLSVICRGSIVSLLVACFDYYPCSAVCLYPIETGSLPTVCGVTVCSMCAVDQLIETKSV